MAATTTSAPQPEAKEELTTAEPQLPPHPITPNAFGCVYVEANGTVIEGAGGSRFVMTNDQEGHQPLDSSLCPFPMPTEHERKCYRSKWLVYIWNRDRDQATADSSALYMRGATVTTPEQTNGELWRWAILRDRKGGQLLESIKGIALHRLSQETDGSCEHDNLTKILQVFVDRPIT